MDSKKLKGATETVSAPKVQKFTKHKPVLPAKHKLSYHK